MPDQPILVMLALRSSRGANCKTLGKDNTNFLVLHMLKKPVPHSLKRLYNITISLAYTGAFGSFLLSSKNTRTPHTPTLQRKKVCKTPTQQREKFLPPFKVQVNIINLA